MKHKSAKGENPRGAGEVPGKGAGEATGEGAGRGSEGRAAKRPFFGLAWKIFLALLLFTAIILALLWLTQVVFFDRIYQEIKIGQIEKTASRIAASTGEEEELAEAASLARREQFCLVVYDLSSDELLLSEDALEGCTLHQILTRKIPGGALVPIRENILSLASAAREAGGGIFYRVTGDNRAGWQDRFPFLPWDGEGDHEVTLTPGTELAREDETSIIYVALSGSTAVFLNAIISPVAATVETMLTLLRGISLLVLLLALLLALVLSRSIARPIEHLTAGAEVLATGDTSVRFPGGGYREVAKLGDTLNYAACELGKVDSLRRDLIANVSHDLRTPLTLISGYAEMMRDLPGESTPENLQIIIDESSRLKELVSDILDLSRLQAGGDEPECAPFDLTSAIESELCRYNKLRDREGYTIRFLYRELVTVNADRRRVMQVVYNLVNNAVNYTGEDKTVTVSQSLSPDGARVRISVTDTGEGIPEDALPHIFERYYREKTPHRRAPIGTGLGLAIVKEIVTAHGGQYGVVSSDKGSTFWFELPCTGDGCGVTPLPQS